jgi:alpha-tubulin suppressor-like RCC1 family protein
MRIRLPVRSRAVLGIVLAAACSSSSTAPPTTTTSVATIVLTPASLTLTVGQSQTVVATLLSSTGAPLTGFPVAWTSNNAAVATVLNGVVTARAVGAATITATADSKSQPLAVTVTAASTGAQAVFLSIAAGGAHSCGISMANRAYCWGSNNLGQVGNGTSTLQFNTPQPVSGNLTLVSVSTGMYHTCALNGAGAAYCWGWNAFGQLGDGSTTNRAVPVLVSGGITFASITAGGNSAVSHSCGLTPTGAAFCWGRNLDGELGDGTTTDRTIPTAVQGGLTFIGLSAGGAHTCGLTATRKVYCWGDAPEIGEGTTTDRSTPTLIAGSLEFKFLTATWWSACGITLANETYCWGYVSSATATPTPTLVSAPAAFAGVFSGNQFSCGVSSPGAAFCWGLNTSGQLGDGTTTTHTTPLPVIGGIVFGKFAIGDGHACGLTSPGLAYCWGRNTLGQLGDGTPINKNVPTAVKSF